MHNYLTEKGIEMVLKADGDFVTAGSKPGEVTIAYDRITIDFMNHRFTFAYKGNDLMEQTFNESLISAGTGLLIIEGLMGKIEVRLS